MSTKRRAYTTIKMPSSRKEEAEFGKGKRGMFICRRCGSCYYLKAWHHGFEKINTRRAVTRKDFQSTLCPACAMIKNKQYEGRVVIYKVPLPVRDGLKALIRSFGNKAFERDCQHRIIGISSEKDMLTVTTSENQLAAKLAKKIRETFHAKRARMVHSAAPSDMATISLSFE